MKRILSTLRNWFSLQYADYRLSRAISKQEEIRIVLGAGGTVDHKVLYNYPTLSALLENAGYKVRLLEWFDEQGNFHHEDWNADEGLIRRSTRFDARNQNNPTAYTSLIIEALKP